MSAPSTAPITAGSLAGLLRGKVAGPVLDDRGNQAVYAHDASIHRVLPQVVVLPASTDDVLAVLEVCTDTGVALTSRGGGTSIAGNAIGPGVVLDFSRHLDAVRDIDVDGRTARVQPGVVLDTLQHRLAPHRLRFGPDPSSHDRCTIGGMIGSNACGSHSVAWGTTADSVQSLTVALPSGDVVVLERDCTDPALLRRLTAVRDAALGPIRAELGRFPRQVSGYALQHLLPEHGVDPARAFVGSEGTLGVVLEARVGLVDLPAQQALVVAGYPDLVAAAAASPGLRAGGPLTVEALGTDVVAAYDSRPGPHPRPTLPRGSAWLLAQVGGASPEEARERAEALAAVARQSGASAVDIVTAQADQRALWRIRERGAGLASRTVDGRESWAGWEDAAVPPERLADYLGEFERLLSDHQRHGVIYGHFGEGCVHVRIDHDLRSAPGRAAYREFQEQATALVVRHGGVPSGEHGDGRARSELLSRVYSPDLLAAFSGLKHVFDPENLLNPGVLVDPAPLDADIGLALARPHHRRLAFTFPDDHGDIGVAASRCVGIGACRRDSGGGMCPSFRATRDERHSTRGRARVLAEMLDGNLADDGWSSTEAHDALDLCLSCKACSNECPVSVDMATYKAEFLHQHYRRRLRPRAHLSLGWLPLWLTLARRVPRLANTALRVRGLHRLAGIDPSRALPTIRADRGARRRPTGGSTRARPDAVLLWADTFTRTFAPQVLDDAVAVLTAAGYAVQLPDRNLCCGLTWVTTGQLGIARRVMQRTVDGLAAYPEMPVVTLEPSCGSTLHDDLPALLGSEHARRVGRRVMTFAQALEGRDLDLRPVDTDEADMVAQFHCHQRASTGTTADLALLERLGVTPTTVDDGCCGLAGSFGFEPGHAEVAQRCAEQSFVPVLERSRDGATVLADGFSCRLQIEQVSGRRPQHLAQLLRRQLR
ncbi:MAG TPA: FAD-binding and (Fe-S)-binding domain-containing protein [Nocardioidaceae bacterium]|nr:FAD-binding and (Fe-S)-binding domain-containing protein [Nocardioidaceae bacterium]